MERRTTTVGVGWTVCEVKNLSKMGLRSSARWLTGNENFEDVACMERKSVSLVRGRRGSVVAGIPFETWFVRKVGVGVGVLLSGSLVWKRCFLLLFGKRR